MSRRIHGTRTMVVATLTMLLITMPLACGSSDGETAEPTGTGAVDTNEGEPPEEKVPPSVDVTAVDYAFEGIPDEVPVGTTFNLSNASDKELHEMVLFRIDDDESRPVSELVTLPPGEMDQVVSQQPAMVSLVMPGSDEMINAVGDATVTEPGRYAVICAIPTGADPEAYLAAARESDDGPPDVPGGPPHLVNGMWAEVVVD